MKKVLFDVYKHQQLRAQLVFKGGTALYLFYDLPRFSVDLDFSLHRSVTLKDVSRQAMAKIVGKYLDIKKDSDKRYTWFWSGSYAKGKQRIKVEISKRTFDDAYAEHDFRGLTVRTLDLASTFAHKLCAIPDRKKLVNRDLFDTWWLLSRHAPIREEIIVQRTGLSVAAYLQKVTDYVQEQASGTDVLFGLGELLTASQKDWVRKHLLSELLFELQLRSETPHLD